MKKLLITGASGFLGRRILEYYKETYEICAPAHKEMDITDEQFVMAIIEKEHPDYVVHCAAISDTGKCEKEPERSWRINVDGSRNIAKAAKKAGAKCLICSSDQVYFGSEISKPHNEDESVMPANVYGREKLQAEQECLEVNEDAVLLRLAWMYDTKTISEKEHGDFMRTLFEKLSANETVSYPVYDKRGITDVNEVVVNIEKAFTLPGGVYNFGSLNHESTYDTVKQAFEEAGWDSQKVLKNEQAFADKPRNLTMSQEKLNQYGITFTETKTAIIEHLKNILYDKLPLY